jgi:hypothetical protein
MVNLKFIGQEEGSPFGVSVTVSGTTRSASVRRAGLADPRHTVGSPASQRPFGISATVASPRARYNRSLYSSHTFCQSGGQHS